MAEKYNVKYVRVLSVHMQCCFSWLIFPIRRNRTFSCAFFVVDILPYSIYSIYLHTHVLFSQESELMPEYEIMKPVSNIVIE